MCLCVAVIRIPDCESSCLGSIPAAGVCSKLFLTLPIHVVYVTEKNDGDVWSTSWNWRIFYLRTAPYSSESSSTDASFDLWNAWHRVRSKANCFTLMAMSISCLSFARSAKPRNIWLSCIWNSSFLAFDAACWSLISKSILWSFCVWLVGLTRFLTFAGWGTRQTFSAWHAGGGDKSTEGGFTIWSLPLSVGSKACTLSRLLEVLSNE